MSHRPSGRTLALGCSALALATALASPAQAQAVPSFQGNATVTFGNANVTLGANTTTVQVNSTSAVIDWTPFDNAVSPGTPINWQPVGTTATFRNNPTSQNQFAVLNRIVPADTSRPIVFNGTVLSRLQQASSLVPGGTVFFYSPGGIVLSPSAVFDVGNLGLTTAPPVVSPSGVWYNGNTVQFGQAPRAASTVGIGAGAQITASAQGSYVAAFAPKIDQYGTVTVNGQAALVAGEAGSITFSPDGLFDIQVSVGSDQGFAIDHRGTTTGPASSGAGDNHRIYMVAIPKNNAMQLAISRGSSVGFAIAGAADVQGNAVVLSAGRNIAAGQIAEAPVGGPGEAGLSINDSNVNQTGAGVDFTSTVTARSTGRAFVDVFRQTRFASDVSVQGDISAQVGVSALVNTTPGALTVAGSLTVSARAAQVAPGVAGDAGTASFFASNGGTASVTRDLAVLAGAGADRNSNGAVLGGSAQVSVSGSGAVNVGRDLVIDSSAVSDAAPGAPTAQGGSARIDLTTAGGLTVGRATRLVANGVAGLGNGNSGQGRNGTGGSSVLGIAGGGVFATGELNITADGIGGRDLGAGAGRGVGGTAQLLVQGTNSRATVNALNITGNNAAGELDFLSAEGFGGQTASANGTGGSAQGGTASMIAAAGGRIALPAATNAFVRIVGRGTGGSVVAGTAGTGGAATGGTVSILADNGTISGGSLLPTSAAQGGSSTNPALATSVINGGNAVGGTRNITIQNGSTFTSAVTGGGPGGIGGNGSASGRGGNGTGGAATTVIDNSAVNVSALGFITFSQNTPGTGAIYGNTSGGTATVTVRNNATVTVAAGGNFSATSSTFAGAAAFSGPAQNGGSVTAGTALMQVQNSTVAGSGAISVEANAAVGNLALTGGTATGGSARLDVVGGSVRGTSLSIRADGDGGDFAATGTPRSGLGGGAGMGGSAIATLNTGTVAVATLAIRAEGLGGTINEAGSSAAVGGAGRGGIAILQGTSGISTVSASDVRVDASGSGGTLFAGTGTGGSGTGGEARIDALANARLTVTAPIAIVAEGDGGSAQAGGTGGAATGGRAYSLAAAGTTTGGNVALTGDLLIDASASSGDGTVAGQATGGLAYLQSIANAVTRIDGNVAVRADAAGGTYLGSGGAGGAARGGTAQILATTGNARLTVTGTAAVSANAQGGVGARDGAGVGGDGGAATAGLAEIGGNAGVGNILSLGGATSLEAVADGGAGVASSGGSATGGTAVVAAGDGTTVGFANAVVLRANARGGAILGSNAPAGSRGGNATGGTARLRTFNIGGAIAIQGTVELSSAAQGGSVFGGSGTGGDAIVGFADIIARGGSVRIDGNLDMFATTLGGSGPIGGNATLIDDAFFESGISVENGSVTVVGDTSFIVEALGGDGEEGGAGGFATAGVPYLEANSSAAGVSSISLGGLIASSSAQGGAGGASTGSAAGGAGGAANGGAVQLLGTAGNGSLTVAGALQIASSATGGEGGASTGGAGGAGGAAVSGYIQFGMRSGADVGPANAGRANFAGVTAISSAQGGEGGASGSGTGGAGGSGISLGGVLLTRGAPVTATTAAITGIGVGGDGGSGATAGAGGFGAGGRVNLTATQRAQRSDRGSVTVGTLTMTALGQGGAGSTPGASYFAGDGGIVLTQSDATLGTASYDNLGTLPPPPSVANPVLPVTLALTGAGLTVDTLSMSTPGEFLLNLDAAQIAANTLAISAGTFVLPATPPATPGTITVRDNLSLAASSTGGAIRSFANFVSRGATGFTAADSIVLGNISAQGLFEAQSLTGSITVGSIDAGAARLTAQGNIQAGNARVTGAFEADSATGSLTLGTVDAASVALAAATDLTANRIAATTVSAEAGGLLSVLGSWTAPTIRVTAGDTAIPDGGALAAGRGGTVELRTANSAGAFVGDGLAGQAGFRLGNAEFARIGGNRVVIGVLDNAANPVDLTIGTLTLSPTQLPGDGSLEFATGTAAGASSGRIRIDGAVTGTGFSATQEIEFSTGSFELNAETGAIALGGSGPGGLGGIVAIDAANIHVAAPAILARLRDDPRFAGVADEINAPAAVARPDGVLRAFGLQLFPSDTLYIQNTGTARNPAGFYTTPDASDIEPPGFANGQAADVDAVINGRFATAAGDISGQDVATAIADDDDASFDGFSDISQVNGCAFSAAACGPAVSDEVPGLVGLQSVIAAVGGQSSSDEGFDLEDGGEAASEESSEDDGSEAQEEEEGEKAARAPIAPPVVLINTRPLNPPVDIVDPVSGSGNPAAQGADPADTGVGGYQ